jgi:hypothetical protein
MESLNSEKALDWSEASRGQIHTGNGETGSAMEHVFALPSGHTIAYIYLELVSSIAFYDNDGENNGNNSLRVQKEEFVKTLIPNGATHLNVKSVVVAAVNRYAYLITG